MGRDTGTYVLPESVFPFSLCCMLYVYLHVHVCIRICIYVNMHVRVLRPEVNVSGLCHLFASHFLAQGFSLSLQLLALARCSGQ